MCALDTELLGHWWHEGVDWLAAVLEEAPRAGLPIARLDEALTRHEPVAAPPICRVTTWGTPRTLWTWDGPRVAGIAWAQRRAELEVVAAGAAAGDRALRELLALQSSDWAFMVSRELAEPYARERVEGHAAGLRAALDAGGVGEAGVRSLAPHLARAALLEP